MTKKRKRPEQPALGPPAAPISPVSILAMFFFVGLLVYWLVFFTHRSSAFDLPSHTNDDVSRLHAVSQVMLLVDSYFYVAVNFGGEVSIVDRVPILSFALFITVLAWLYGVAILKAVKVGRGLTRLEIHIFAVAVGLNVVSLLTLFVGLTIGYRFGWQWGVVAGGVALLAYIGKQPFANTELQASSVESSNDVWGNRLRWASAPFFILILLGAMMPPVDFDVREYHLQVPKEWFRQGHVSFMPHNIYGNMPLGSEMHAVLASALFPGELNWWFGALVGKTILGGYTLLTALGVYAAGRRFINTFAGAVGMAAYVSAPWITHVSMQGLNESAVACYTFLALYGALLWRREQDAGVKRSHLLLTGFLAGASAACKYPSVVFVVIPILGFIAVSNFVSTRNGRRSAARSTAIACSLFVLAVVGGSGLWYIKNAALTGNPVYPLAFDLFGGVTRNETNNAQWERAHAAPPYSIQEASNALANVLWRSKWHTPLVAPFAILGVVICRQRNWIWIIVGMIAFDMIVWWLFTHRIDRFWIPLLPLAALLAGCGAGQSENRSWRVAVIAAVGVGLAACFFLHWAPPGDRRYFASLRSLREEGLPQKDEFGRVDPFHRYMNENTPAGKTVLLVGDAQPFDLKPKAYYNTCFDECVFERWMKGHNAKERITALQEHNVAFVYIHWGEIARYRSPGNYGFTDYVTRERIAEMVRHDVLKKVDFPSPDFEMMLSGELYEAGRP